MSFTGSKYIYLRPWYNTYMSRYPAESLTIRDGEVDLTYSLSCQWSVSIIETMQCISAFVMKKDGMETSKMLSIKNIEGRQSYYQRWRERRTWWHIWSTVEQQTAQSIFEFIFITTTGEQARCSLCGTASMGGGTMARVTGHHLDQWANGPWAWKVCACVYILPHHALI